jgi:hypothetical protein
MISMYFISHSLAPSPFWTLSSIGRTAERRSTRPPRTVVEEALTPVVEGARTPVVEEARTPVVEEARTPVVEEARTPVVEEARAPGG